MTVEVAQGSKFQSTLPRGERLFRDQLNVALQNISIHAPTGGATLSHPPERRERPDFNPRSHGGSDGSPGRVGKESEISIHAPTGGATTASQKTADPAKNFNPRSHGGSDGISGHFIQRAKNFNPRSHGGSDFLSFYIVHMFHIFQSTLPRGERRRVRSSS